MKDFSLHKFCSICLKSNGCLECFVNLAANSTCDYAVKCVHCREKGLDNVRIRFGYLPINSY